MTVTNEASSTGPGRRVLVVEDEPFIGDALVAGLRHAGFDARSVTTGGSALDEARTWSPDLLLLDVMLPDMSGFDVSRTLVTDGSNAGVIFLTARDEVSDRMRGFGVGADDYVTKPFSLEEVIARVRAVLRRRSPDPRDRPRPTSCATPISRWMTIDTSCVGVMSSSPCRRPSTAS